MINTWNESDLHNSIKLIFAGESGKIEEKVEGKIVDVLKDDQIIEIQTTNFSSLRNKLDFLENIYPIKLVYPLIRKKIITVVDKDGEILRTRKSPKTGRFLEVFKELIYITDIFMSPNFRFEIIQVDIEEIRADDGKGSWRRKGISIKNRVLKKTYPGRVIDDPIELFDFLQLRDTLPLDSKKLSKFLGIKPNLSQKILYFFKNTGVIYPITKKGNLIIYQSGII